ncbi:MAG: GTPase [Candidatus Woesearchaeota archaeon]
MDFQKIIQLREPDFYLDVAFKRSKGQPNQLEIFSNYLIDTFDKIVRSFPSFDNLSEFHKELVSNFFDYDLVKKHLGTLNWASQKIRTLQNQYKKSFNEDKKHFFGRASSVVHQIKPSLEYLENARKMLREFPNIKDLYTVSIAGFPNVGKTTLLSKITSSKPEINSYAFTTKVINIGYIDRGLKKIQILDTPGTLNRPDKMNIIEKQAYLAMRYVTDLIVYIFDLTEPYTLNDQTKLFENIKKYDKEIVIYLSKQDLVGEKFEEFSKKYNNKIITNPEELIDFIVKKA